MPAAPVYIVLLSGFPLMMVYLAVLRSVQLSASSTVYPCLYVTIFHRQAPSPLHMTRDSSYIDSLASQSCAERLILLNN
jgi:hypothetical protein